MPPTILHFHDDPEGAHSLDALLVAAGYGRLITCGYSRYAVDLIQQIVLDLVLVDITREPSTSGWRLVEEIARNPESRGTPIIVCAADSSNPAVADLGCAVVSKPIVPDDLLQQVAHALGA